MNYVSEKSAAKARSLAKRFRDLSSSAGVLFVSVAAVPVETGESKIFDVCLGMSSVFDPKLGIALVKKVLEDELKQNEVVLRDVTVYRGISGAACDRGDESDEGARPH